MFQASFVPGTQALMGIWLSNPGVWLRSGHGNGVHSNFEQVPFLADIGAKNGSKMEHHVGGKGKDYVF
jgi:hypothetical protein